MSITTSTTLTQEFVDILTAQMLIAPDPQYIFAKLAMGARMGAMPIPEIVHVSGVSGNMAEAMGGAMGTLDLNPRFQAIAKDFVLRVEEIGTGPGKVFLLDQPQYLTAGVMTEPARRLTEGTQITANPQAVTMGQVTLTCREYGGPHDGTNVAPVAVTDFLKRRAKHDLVEYLGLLLRRDRNAWLDAVLSAMLLSTTNVTYGSGAGSLSAATAGSDPLVDSDLAAVKLALQSRGIPTFSDGFYFLVISPQHESDLRKDSQFREIVRYLGADGPLVQGHLGSYNGFHIVVSNNMPSTGVGSGGAVTGHQGVAFGPQAVGWGVGMEAEARRSKADDFGREDRVVWMSHEAFGLLNGDFVQKLITT